MIHYGKQLIDRSDRLAVDQVLRSSHLTQGPVVPQFEKALAKACGARFAVAVSSGTAALHLASLAIGLKRGEKAVTSPITFIATPNSILYTGARALFADVDAVTGNLSPEFLAKVMRGNVAAVYPVHLNGLPCAMPAIHALAKKHGARVVEDASHALGASYRVNSRWVPVGSCRHADMAIFSFHPVKSITTGEGGAITTNNPALCEKLRQLRSHGVIRNPQLTRTKGPWYYEMRQLGFNYRLSDIHAALGLSQLAKLPVFMRKRRRIAAAYHHAFASLRHVTLPLEPRGYRSAYHLYPLQVDFKKLRVSRTFLMRRLARLGIGTQVHYIPVYRQPYYRRLGYPQNLAGAESYYEKEVSLPIYPEMTPLQVRKVIHGVLKSLKA